MSEEHATLAKPSDGIATGTVSNPFARTNLPDHISAGSVEIESQRAISEVQAKLVIGKRYPRNLYDAFNRLIEQCHRYDFAEKAAYSYKRGGETVSGPSIRLAEEIARCYGNIEYGLRELSQKDGESEMEAFAWDYEANVISSHRFTVKHRRETRNGAYDLTSERDIYEITANMGARRMRARILAIVPPEFTDAAVDECKKTLARGNGKSIEERRKSMVQAFAQIGVTVKMLEEYTTQKIATLTSDDIASLIGVYQSIKQGAASKESFFGSPALEQPKGKPAEKKTAPKEPKQNSTTDLPPEPKANIPEEPEHEAAADSFENFE